MEKDKNILDSIFKIQNEKEFNDVALKTFSLQSQQNSIYKKYIKYLNITPSFIDSIDKIPFLPIEFFKMHDVVRSGVNIEVTFTSSGTTGITPSKHHIVDLQIYEQSFLYGFSYFFGNIKDYCILALLPSYLEREGSSLVYMADKLIHITENNNSGFYLNNLDELVKKINSIELKNKKILLLGVSYALLDLAENYKLNHPQLIVMETGGMKGRRKEMIREELHNILCTNLNVDTIYSEYGMTELLSQAYSFGKGIFSTPPWMKILIRDMNDPLTLIEEGKGGGINVIDLANVNSCSFIMTQDLGKKLPDQQFKILGRFDSSDIRGCNLLIT
jgi:phenylacetate-coenzyme A ligase PaaK-like adenylate-forming protein